MVAEFRVERPDGTVIYKNYFGDMGLPPRFYIGNDGELYLDMDHPVLLPWKIIIEVKHDS